MTLKYEITDIQHPRNPKLFRIRALRDNPRVKVKVGYLGGYVQYEHNLSHEEDCWINGDACVYGNVHVTGTARISGHACVFGNARVFGNAQVCNNARVYNNARIFGQACVLGNVHVTDNARVSGDSQVSGDVQVCNNARVSGNAWILGNIILNENMEITGGGVIKSLDQIYYVDGVTAYFNLNGELTVNGFTPGIEHHETLARLKLL